MFQYTHELVLNNPVASMKAGQCKDYITGESVDAVLIKRGGEYRKDLMANTKIFVTPGHVGALDKITLKVAGLGLEAGKNYALNIFVKLVDPHAMFEYGYPNYKSFGKQILVDFKSVDAATDAHTILDSILPQVMENDLTFVKGVVNTTEASGDDPATADVVLEVGHFGLRFDSIAIAEYDPTACDSCIGEYMTPVAILDNGNWSAVNATKIAHTVTGIDPFATGEWLIENLRFPSYPNIRWAAIGEENRPIASQLYTMVSFEYSSPRPGLGGVSGVGQKLEAATRHIYYVPSDQAATFVGYFTSLNPTGLKIYDVPTNGGAPVARS